MEEGFQRDDCAAAQARVLAHVRVESLLRYRYRNQYRYRIFESALSISIAISTAIAIVAPYMGRWCFGGSQGRAVGKFEIRLRFQLRRDKSEIRNSAGAAGRHSEFRIPNSEFDPETLEQSGLPWRHEGLHANRRRR
jgi:hypothetical protein